MLKFLLKIWWFLCDVCEDCGGEIQWWDDRHGTCLDCKKEYK